MDKGIKSTYINYKYNVYYWKQPSKKRHSLFHQFYKLEIHEQKFQTGKQLTCIYIKLHNWGQLIQ